MAERARERRGLEERADKTASSVVVVMERGDDLDSDGTKDRVVTADARAVLLVLRLRVAHVVELGLCTEANSSKEMVHWAAIGGSSSSSVCDNVRWKPASNHRTTRRSAACGAR